MKTTIKTINNALESLQENKIKALKVELEQLKANYLENQVKAFNVNITDKKAIELVQAWHTATNFKNSMKDDYKELTENLDLESMEDLKRAQFYADVVSVGNTKVNKALRPLRTRIKEMYKHILGNNRDGFNLYMNECFKVELTEKQFNALYHMLNGANSRGLKAMSIGAFENTLMYLIIGRLLNTSHYSTKTLKGCYKRVYNDIMIVKESDYETMERGFALTLADEFNIKLSKDERDNYMYVVQKVRAKARKEYVVIPNFMAEELEQQ